MKNKAFTLIELLVVVLIIGILSAIALPQYETAVLKTKFSTILPLGRVIKEAQERYYMANGKYALALADLDIELPGYCTVSAQGDGNMWFCGDEWFVDNTLAYGEAVGYSNIYFCPGSDKTNYLDRRDNNEAVLTFYYDHPDASYTQKAGQIGCLGKTTKGQKICKTFMGLLN